MKPVFASLSSGNLSFNVGFPLTGIDKYETGDGFGHFGLLSPVKCIFMRR